MLRRVQQYIRQHHLLQQGERVLVCVSGGADSMALWDVLRRGGYDCIVAHCNFHLRAEESDRDEAFVREQIAPFSPLIVQHFDTTAYARQRGIGIEMAARELRYQWFAQLACQERCQAIAVAHHQHDQAETLLLNLKRGTGIRGLCGMRPKSDNPMGGEAPIIRPLLCTTRDYIEHYLRDIRHLSWVDDSTNANTDIARNAIRKQLAHYNKAEIEHMAATAEYMQGYVDWLENRDTMAAGRVKLYEEIKDCHFPEVDKIYDALQRGEGGKTFYSLTHKAVIRQGRLHITRLEPMPAPPTISATEHTAIERRFGIIGKPLEHSYSARYFSDKFEREHISANYCLYEIDNLEGIAQLMNDLEGFNVTYPYKEAIIPFLRDMDAVAAAIGAVNVVSRGVGYNTDWLGFMQSLQPHLRAHDTRAIILGTGGVSKAVQYALTQMGIAYTLVSRQAKGNVLCYSDLTLEHMHTHSLIINCTPLGMLPDIHSLPDLPYEHLTPHHLLYDCVYNPASTAFLQQGEQRGARILNGLQMLYAQADIAWKIWNN